MNDSQRTMQALLTYEDYCQIPSDENRYEVIDGALFMSPSPVERHQRIFTHLIIRLGPFCGGIRPWPALWHSIRCNPIRAQCRAAGPVVRLERTPIDYYREERARRTGSAY